VKRSCARAWCCVVLKTLTGVGSKKDQRQERRVTRKIIQKHCLYGVPVEKVKIELTDGDWWGSWWSRFPRLTGWTCNISPSSSSSLSSSSSSTPSFNLHINTWEAAAQMAQRVERWTCDQQVVGSTSCWGHRLRNNLGQVFHVYVPLSPSSITWHWPRGGDSLRLGR